LGIRREGGGVRPDEVRVPVTYSRVKELPVRHDGNMRKAGPWIQAFGASLLAASIWLTWFERYGTGYMPSLPLRMTAWEVPRGGFPAILFTAGALGLLAAAILRSRSTSLIPHLRAVSVIGSLALLALFALWYFGTYLQMGLTFYMNPRIGGPTALLGVLVCLCGSVLPCRSGTSVRSVTDLSVRADSGAARLKGRK
jgi:hypothetical protein